MLLAVFLAFAKIGAFSFGGGYAMIPLISREIVQARAWLSMTEFIDVIALSQATPGPIAVNAATYAGYKVAGFWGSVSATAGVTLPSVVIMLALGLLLSRYGELRPVKDAFRGIRPAVVALIAAAAASVASASLTGPVPIAVAAAAAVAVLRFRVDPVLLLAASGALGYFLYR